MSSNATIFTASDSTDPAIPGDPFLRLRYHYGQLLGAEDFAVEQRAGLLAARLHQAALHGAGTVAGLAVTAQGAEGEGSRTGARLLVAPGLAVDALGRTIHVERLQCLDVRGLHRAEDWASFPADVPTPAEAGEAEAGEAEAGEGGAGEAEAGEAGQAGALRHAWVVLRYLACETEPIPAISPACGDGSESVSYSRIQDRFRLCLEAAPPPDPHALQRDWLPPEGERPGWAGDGREGWPVVEGCADLRGRLLAWTLQAADRLARLWSSPADAAETGVLLARVDLRLVGEGDEAFVELVAVDNRVRPLLPPVQLVAEQLTGHRLLGADTCGRLRVLAMTGRPLEGDEALRVQIALSGPPLAATAPGAVLLQALDPAAGWQPVSATVQVDGSSLLVTVAGDAALPADVAAWQLRISGAGDAPLLDLGLQPLAGWWSDARPAPGRGLDACLVDPFTPAS